MYRDNRTSSYCFYHSHFLPHVTQFCLSVVIDMVTVDCPSVRLSVCLSITFTRIISTKNRPTITRFLPNGSPKTPIPAHQRLFGNLAGVLCSGARNKGGVRKIESAISRYVSETLQASARVTVEYEIICDLSDGVIFIDFE